MNFAIFRPPSVHALKTFLISFFLFSLRLECGSSPFDYES